MKSEKHISRSATLLTDSDLSHFFTFRLHSLLVPLIAEVLRYFFNFALSCFCFPVTRREIPKKKAREPTSVKYTGITRSTFNTGMSRGERVDDLNMKEIISLFIQADFVYIGEGSAIQLLKTVSVGIQEKGGHLSIANSLLKEVPMQLS